MDDPKGTTPLYYYLAPEQHRLIRHAAYLAHMNRSAVLRALIERAIGEFSTSEDIAAWLRPDRAHTMAGRPPRRTTMTETPDPTTPDTAAPTPETPAPAETPAWDDAPMSPDEAAAAEEAEQKERECWGPPEGS